MEEKKAKEKFELTYHYTKKGVKIFYKDDFICYFEWRNYSHTKIESPQNSLNKFLRAKRLDTEKNIQLIKNELVALEKKSKSLIKKKYIGIEPDLSIKTWDQLENIIEEHIPERIYDIKLLLCVVISILYSENDFIYLGIIAPSGIGKSLVCRCYADSDMVINIDSVTMEAFAPGTADSFSDPHSLLDESKGKTLFIHDLIPLLTSGEMIKQKFFGMITGSYGSEPFRKFSPGTGKAEHGGGYNFIFGLTPQYFHSHKRVILGTGRTLIYKLEKMQDEIEIIRSGKTSPDIKAIQEALLGFIINIKKRKEKRIILIMDDIRDYCIRFFEILPSYKLIWKKKGNKKSTKGTTDVKDIYEYHGEYDEEGMLRPYYQFIMLAKSLCLIEDRLNISKEDLKFFRPLFWGLDDIQVRQRKLDQVPRILKLTDEDYLLYETIRDPKSIKHKVTVKKIKKDKESF